MRPQVQIEPEMKLIATVLFLTREPLFVSLLGPSGVSFGSTWACEAKEIINESNDTWQISIQASHRGPIGSEVSVRVMHQSGDVTLVVVGDRTAPEALLVCAVVPRG